MEAETLWLSEQQIAMVFERDRTVIGRHIKNIIKTGELHEISNVQKMHIANSDKPVIFYNLDMILSVGYRVNSKRGTQFRIWGNRILKEHLVQGYTINQKRLQKQRTRFTRLQADAGQKVTPVLRADIVDEKGESEASCSQTVARVEKNLYVRRGRTDRNPLQV